MESPRSTSKRSMWRGGHSESDQLLCVHECRDNIMIDHGKEETHGATCELKRGPN